MEKPLLYLTLQRFLPRITACSHLARLYFTLPPCVRLRGTPDWLRAQCSGWLTAPRITACSHLALLYFTLPPCVRLRGTPDWLRAQCSG